MKKPELSEHYKGRSPSVIRMAQIEFMKRKGNVEAVNVAIGNVSLPVHPAMERRMFDLDAKTSPFRNGVVKYTPTVGVEETREAFLNIIASSGFSIKGLYPQVTDGGSQAMELVILGACGPAGSGERPLLLIDAAYTNYPAMALRIGRTTVSVQRALQEDGRFTLPDIKEIERMIETERPGAMVVIPYDNPTGHFYDHETMVMLAGLCVEHNLWMISDEAYRELFYVQSKTSSIWGITEREVSGIEGRRISIETASKVWNACGLRIGALVTDSKEFHEKAVAENTANLCTNAIGQYIFGALAHENHNNLKKWYDQQRAYYKPMISSLNTELKKLLPGIIVSAPDASIYSVIDVRNIVPEAFDAKDFVLYCARKGRVKVDEKLMTLLVAPMEGFYNVEKGEKNPGRTQMRIAYVEPPVRMKLVPTLFAELFRDYIRKKGKIHRSKAS
ncbi:MAG: aminotransferase class I/II-fold pyridoxal phosphate-dependent enzyme [Spirochaetota bacterium]|nr:MAG: aminotransferase class I/II-fold pyridoxal phosphate-dependent enzyme [Spirochaetota bacterium]